jgi:hypothetical protein
VEEIFIVRQSPPRLRDQHAIRGIGRISKIVADFDFPTLAIVVGWLAGCLSNFLAAGMGRQNGLSLVVRFHLRCAFDGFGVLG